MKSKIFTLITAIFCAVFLSSNITAQDAGKAKVKIKKSENGSTEEYSEEFELKDGQDIQDILKQLNLLDEFGQLKDGQAFEINIRKLNGDEELQNYDISFFPEEKQQGFLGVRIRDNDVEGNSSDGVYITEIIEGTAAEEAGLLAGDIIIEVNNSAVTKVDQLIELIVSNSSGENVKIEIIREGKKKKIDATLGERTDQSHYYFNHDEMQDFSPQFDMQFEMPEMPEMPDNAMIWFNNEVQMEEGAFLGVTPSCSLADETGVRIGRVVEGSSAEDMGILEGDRVISFNGMAVSNFDELTDQILTATPGEKVSIELIRGDKQMKVKGEIGKREFAKCDEMKIFENFKGMDEGGDLFYDYEFNIDSQDLEKWNELKELFNEQEDKLSEAILLHTEASGNNDSELNIRIEVENITNEELEAVNSSANPPLRNDNDLQMNQISFYPNPSNGMINLQFDLAQEGDIDIYIFDQAGSIVFSETRMNFSGNYANVIDISNEADGAYFLQIVQNGKTYSKKLIKNS